ncbi:unnamed protein product [Soboliphyme baturini]|uniref:Uncharacterized protein n=1 Tax=Soboliphyme baturini TaxID=241478 RepID=A0A183IKY9_9BILA|nr:unnamed protein product [Soboliphyme baturini]
MRRITGKLEHSNKQQDGDEDEDEDEGEGEGEEVDEDEEEEVDELEDGYGYGSQKRRNAHTYSQASDDVTSQPPPTLHRQTGRQVHNATVRQTDMRQHEDVRQRGGIEGITTSLVVDRSSMPIYANQLRGHNRPSDGTTV